VPLAIGAGRLISAQLYGVSSWDPMALGIAAIGACHLGIFRGCYPCTPCSIHFENENIANGVASHKHKADASYNIASSWMFI
jgi:hypothetical protein